MTRIILNGCNGKMGRAITKMASEDEACEIVAGIDINAQTPNTYPVFTKISDCDIKADVIVDFSHPSCFDDVIDYAKRTKTAVIIATTGLSKEQRAEIGKTAKEIPTFFSANMSLGINLLIALSQKATAILGDKFDIEIVEQHHNQKLDAPSGTALVIADGINDVLSETYRYAYDRHLMREPRKKKEIGIHSVRGGTIVGKHKVIFAGNDEVIELSHEASSKEVFALGAISAAKFMTDKPVGLYSMAELVGEMI